MRRASVTRDGDGERGERDLELSVVGLDGRDLLNQKARPQEDAQRSARRVPGQEALELEGDGGDEGQEGSFNARKSKLSPSLPKPSWGKNGPSALNTTIETSATITMKVVPQRGCSVVRLRALSTLRPSPDS